MDALLYKLNNVLGFASLEKTLESAEGFLSSLEGYVLFFLARWISGCGRRSSCLADISCFTTMVSGRV